MGLPGITKRNYAFTLEKNSLAYRHKWRKGGILNLTHNIMIMLKTVRSADMHF